MKLIETFKSFFQSATPSAGDDFWYEDAVGGSASGARISPESAMAIAAVYSCVNILASSVASLPLVVYRKLPNGGKEEIPTHPLYNLLKYQPNALQTRYNFMQMLVGHAALRGNFYAEIVYNNQGFIEELYPLNPAKMQVEATRNRGVRFVYWDDEVGKRVYLPSELLRFTGLSSDGVTGLSVVAHARETFGIALQTENYAARFFKNDSKPGGILQSDLPMTAEAQKANRESWERAHRGAANAHKIAVLQGLKFQQIGMTNEDSQFLETRKFTKAEICGIFGIPPHLIADLERSTFSNIEQQDIGFYKHTIRHWVTNIEQTIKRDLILEQDVYAEFKVDALLRGDSQSRAEYYSKALGSGGSPAWMTQAEVRQLENLNPIEGADKLWQPTNTPSQEATAAMAIDLTKEVNQ